MSVLQKLLSTSDMNSFSQKNLQSNNLISAFPYMCSVVSFMKAIALIEKNERREKK